VTRDAAGIGAGLAAAREAHRIEPGERIHVVGAAGAGASAAALLAQHAGAIVSGCDAGGPSPYSAALEAAGIELAWGHDPSHVTGEPAPSRLAVTKALTAIDPDHPELATARAAGIPLESWQQVVADAAIGRTLVGVAGTHGKSTSAGWLVHTLVEAGLDPSAFVGALLPAPLTGGVPSTARSGQGTAFVVEADEYAGNFDAYRPDVAVITGAEWDHPDVFADRDAVVDAFVVWLRRAPAGATAVVNVADLGGSLVAAGLEDVAIQVVATALLHDTASDADLTGGARALQEGFATAAGPARALLARIVEQGPDVTLLRVHGLGGPDDLDDVRLRTAGRHNAANALGVIGAAATLGTPRAAIVAGVASFAGVGRRLERKGAARDVVVYDDYGHHPTAIRETIGAIRQREPGRRVWAVYEPLTYHRTAALLSAFADALATADAVVVADIWAGRDPDTTVASAAGLAAAVARLRPGIPIAAPGSVDASADWLAHEVRPGDAVLVMGGGHSYQIATGLLERLEGSEAS
jgi:UDP-N-acetylmuramate--alanine ligase